MRIASVKNAFIFLTLTTALLWVPFSAQAFSPWAGQISANINLRTAPGLNGRIITGIDRGAMVEVRAQQGDWYQIERQTDAFGYIGWVYAQYVEPASSAGQASHRSERVSPQPLPVAAIHPPAPATAAAASTLEPRQDAAVSPLQPAPLAPSTAAQTITDPARTAPLLTAETKTAARPVMPAQGPAASDSSPLPLVVTGATQPSPKPHPAPVPMTAAAQSPAPQAPVARAMAQPPAEIKPVMASNPALSAPESPAEITTMTAPAATPYAGPRALVGLALRLTTVIFSCLALLLAFKAFQIARETAAQTAIARTAPFDKPPS
ncbi:MAG: SH3 domain-containing protein [Desulfobacterales bacterium]|nr:SH3 domain-containing protein [Desulfobacterales bacterium]